MNLFSDETAALSTTLNLTGRIAGATPMEATLHMAYADDGRTEQLVKMLGFDQLAEGTAEAPPTLTGMSRPGAALLEAQAQVQAVCWTGWPDFGCMERALAELEDQLVLDLNAQFGTEGFRVTRISISRPALRAKALTAEPRCWF